MYRYVCPCDRLPLEYTYSVQQVIGRGQICLFGSKGAKNIKPYSKTFDLDAINNWRGGWVEQVVKLSKYRVLDRVSSIIRSHIIRFIINN